MIAPQAIFEIAALKVNPEFNSNTLPMTCQVEKHINADEFRYNRENMWNLSGDMRYQRIMTKFDLHHSYRHMLTAKNKDALKHMKQVKLQQVQPVQNDW